MDTDWVLLSFEPGDRTPAEKPRQKETPPADACPSGGDTLPKGVCSKCGCHIGRGLFLHTRHCRI